MATKQRKRLGEIFIEQGLVTPKTVERVLGKSQRLGRRLGTVLEDLGLVTGDELASALATQYNARIVTNLQGITVPPELLQLIPGEVAMQNMIIPLKRDKNLLAVAMVDPTDTRVVDNIASDHGLQIFPYLASRAEIRAAIVRNYFGRDVAPAAEKRTVLVVDDERVGQTMICDQLKVGGYRTITANDGMEGFKSVLAESPHLVITDLVMPKLDGYGLLNAIQNSPDTRHLPVIMVTGHPRDDNEEQRAFDKGFFDVIHKPFKPAALLARVKRAFHFYDNQYRLF
jgi:CheY-like chemotaxis protein